VLPVTLADGRSVPAQTYVADHLHADFAGGWSPAIKAAIIAAAEGGRGSNRDYLERTMGQLAALGIVEPGLEELARLVREGRPGAGGSSHAHLE
jgi:cation transport protein ChaC